MSHVYVKLIRLTPAVFLIVSSLSHCQADLVKLQHGGELRALKSHDNNGELWQFNTTTGGLVELEPQQVEFIAPRLRQIEEYEIRARLRPETAEGCWELAQWCREQGLVDERDQQLEQLLALDPDHAEARKLLGYIAYNGAWTTREEIMASRGYVKHKGKYVTPEELELMERSAQEREQISQWYPQVRVALMHLQGGDPQQSATAIEQLHSINDDLAVPALTRYMQKNQHRDIRELYINTLGQLSGPRTVTALVEQALYDIDAGLRALSVRLISPADQSHAMGLLVEALKSSENRVVRHAAAALGLIGDQKAIPYLIDALVTTHRYQVQQDVASTSVTMGGGNSRFGTPSAGSPDLAVGAMTGQYPVYGYSVQNQLPRLTQTVTIRREEQNWECLQALEAMTEQNFGYDERSWKLWYLAEAGNWK